MNKTIKLICTDIDGTLLNADRWLSQETITAFAKANLPIILASSRPPQAMRYLQEGLGVAATPMIAFNGGLILGNGGTVLESITFSTAILQTVLVHQKKHTYNLSIYSHEHWFTSSPDEWSLREINNTRCHPSYQSARESLLFLNTNGLGIHKLMCMGSPYQLDELISILYDRYGSTIHLYRSKDTYLEITPKAIDKAKALRWLLEAHYDFGLEHVVSFGDNHNDTELLRHSGYGVATANATRALKEIADFISPYTNKENAVARTLHQLLKM